MDERPAVGAGCVQSGCSQKAGAFGWALNENAHEGGDSTSRSWSNWSDVPNLAVDSEYQLENQQRSENQKDADRPDRVYVEK